MNRKTLAVCLLVGALMWVVLGVVIAAAARADVIVDYTVDGDTLRLADGQYVRVIGIDTPEVGQCGYEKAKRKMNRLAGVQVRLILPAGHENTDRYGRLLRYVETTDGRDAGKVLLKKGLANARYDSWDGYPFHPRQYRYRAIDNRTPHVCPALD